MAINPLMHEVAKMVTYSVE